MSAKQIDISGLADHREGVGRIIAGTFFPPPQFRWETMSPTQRDEFLECADEIFTYLRRYGWKP